MKTLSQPNKDFLDKLSQLLDQEKQEDYDIHQQYMNSSSLQERRTKGVSWHPLDITETGFGLGEYPYLIVERTKMRDLSHQFSGGKAVKLFAQADETGEMHITGIVNWADKNRMKIVLSIDEIPHWVKKESLGVSLEFDETTYSEMLRIMDILKSEEDENLLDLLEKVGGQQSVQNKNHHPIQIDSLNDSQNLALNTILRSEDIAIVHGPPGTGKTTTLVEAIAQLSKTEKRILVCAPSNAAVDYLTTKLHQKGLKVIRVGNLSRINEQVFDLTLDGSIAKHERFKDIKQNRKKATEYRNLAQKYKRNFGREEREQRNMLYKEARACVDEAKAIQKHIVDNAFEKAQVVLTTLVGSANPSVRNLSFDTAVIDEAAQALEPATWIPISKAKKVVLAGDPFQLPPTIKSNKAMKNGLSVTLMERAMKKVESVVLLDTQYRMNKSIMEFSNREFYDGQLKAHDSVESWSLTPEELVIEYIDTAGCGYNEEQNSESKSLSNPEEAQLILRHLSVLSEQVEDINSFTIGVISPYKQQVLLMQDTFKEEGLQHIQVNTIDSFQGQERDVIYISLVRSNENGEIGFLKDYRRLNVAMTRAKKKLVLIGDSATLSTDPFFDRFIKYTEEVNAYRSGWEFMSYE